VGKIWKIIIKFILPACIFCLWIEGIYSTLSQADSVSITISAILLAVIIVLPIILSKLPAKNEDYYAN
jgi:NSS family neurotransmitter:Na+ symporter